MVLDSLWCLYKFVKLVPLVYLLLLMSYSRVGKPPRQGASLPSKCLQHSASLLAVAHRPCLIGR